MTSVPGVDHPEEQSEADVTLPARRISVSARVESVHGGVITVRPSASQYAEQAVVAAGDRVDVHWTGPESQRAMPCRVLSVEAGSVVRWRLETAGPAEESQRRNAVRARVVLPVEIRYGSAELPGELLDLSEGGIRVVLDGFGLPPEEGARVEAEIAMEDGPLTGRGEVVRQQTRGARWTMSIQFVDLPEKEGDRVRRRVFQALREERARANG